MDGSSVTKTQRLLDLVAYLVGRRTPATVDEILEKLPAYAGRWTEGSETDRESVRRTFERDKRTLREAGLPLETVSLPPVYGNERVEGYRIRARDLYLPWMELVREHGEDGGRGSRVRENVPAVSLSESEAALALGALRRMLRVPGMPLEGAARSALRKVRFDLEEMDASGPVLEVVDPHDTAALADRLSALFRAVRGRRLLRFRYDGIHRNRPTRRLVEPYGLFFRLGRWYLVGRDRKREGLRLFRVDRMGEPRIPAEGEAATEAASGAGEEPDFEIPADFELEAFLDRRPWELGAETGREEVQAEVRLGPGAALRLERGGIGEAAGEDDAGRPLRRFRVRRPEPFLRWLLSLGEGLEILQPGSWQETLRSMALRVAELHTDPDAHLACPPARPAARRGAERPRAGRPGEAAP